ncbi:MAG: penicillin-binding protein, partial [Phormidesmis sp. CAN_BIN44]|nr:penicillin-binding protein [Phormidesmis sp. CAN_BIN44]
MTDEPNKNRQMAPRSRRSRKNRRFASLLNNLRLPGLKSRLDQVGERLNELEQKLPPPLRNPVVRRRLLWVGVLVGGFGAFKIAAWQIDRSLPNPADLAVFARPGTLTIK